MGRFNAGGDGSCFAVVSHCERSEAIARESVVIASVAKQSQDDPVVIANEVKQSQDGHEIASTATKTAVSQ